MWQDSEKETQFELRFKIRFRVPQGEKNEVCCKHGKHVPTQGDIQIHDRTMWFTKIETSTMYVLCGGESLYLIEDDSFSDRKKCFVMLWKEHWLDDVKTRFSLHQLTVRLGQISQRTNDL